MLNKKFLLTFFLTLNSMALADDYNYDDVKAESAKDKAMPAEIEYWNQEANILVAQIDAALKRYRDLKSEASNEIAHYRGELLKMVDAEKQRKEIVEKECKKERVNCSAVDVHQSNIYLFQDRVKRLDEVKVNH